METSGVSRRANAQENDASKTLNPLLLSSGWFKVDGNIRNSSATAGSSNAMVPGKNRFPAMRVPVGEGKRREKCTARDDSFHTHGFHPQKEGSETRVPVNFPAAQRPRAPGGGERGKSFGHRPPQFARPDQEEQRA